MQSAQVCFLCRKLDQFLCTCADWTLFFCTFRICFSAQENTTLEISVHKSFDESAKVIPPNTIFFLPIESKKISISKKHVFA